MTCNVFTLCCVIAKLVCLLLIHSPFVESEVLGKTTVLNGYTFKWTHSTKLLSGMEVNWLATDPDYVTIEMKGPGKGYIALGFSPSGGMAGADIFVGWVDSNGNANLLDMHGTRNGQPVLDKVQNLELLAGEENDNGTLIIFRRKWDTCDYEQDFAIGDDTMRMIWAINPNDPTYSSSLKSFVPINHGKDVLKRGVKSIFMKDPRKHLKFPDDEKVYPQNTYHIDLTVTNVTVPKAETYYHCKILKFPKLVSKHHIIAHRPLIAPASIPHIHHISIYKCHVPEVLGLEPSDIFENYVNYPGGDCYTTASPPEWTEYCFEFRAAVGVGGEGDVLPDHLGDVIGDTDAPTYYRIEVHYENPQGKRLIDSSGIRLFYTSVLRQYEVGVLFSGHRRTPFLTIPPHQENFSIYGLCGSECTSQGLPKSGIKIISVLLHAHLTGRKMTLRHIRNGKELPPIAEDSHLDFNYQQYRALKEAVTVLPGDQLITECTYNTAKNDTFVFGGLSARREMCETFIVYYPKSDLVDCRSQPEFYSYFNAIGIQNASGEMVDMLNLPFSSNRLPTHLKDVALADDSLILENGRVDNNSLIHDMFSNVVITSPKNLEGYDVHDYMTNLNWEDKQLVKSIQDKWKLGFHYLHCSAPGGKKIHISKDAYSYPIYDALEIPKKVCTASSSAMKMGRTSHYQQPLALAVLVIFSVLVLVFTK